MEKRMRAENIGELQIWMEGQFDLVKQEQTHAGDDLRMVRAKVHDLSNDVAKILALDIAGKLEKLEKADQGHDAAIEKFREESVARRANVTLLKTMWGLGGAAFGMAGTVVLELYKVIHS